MDGAVAGQGLRDTRAALSEWRRDGWRIVERWVTWSLIVAVGLLGSVYLVAELSAPDPAPLGTPGTGTPGTLGDAAYVLTRNALVLALHALACVAGFIAGSSLPRRATSYQGLRRTVHEKAGSLAIVFVAAAISFSLVTQALTLGDAASTVAARLELSPGLLIAALLPHALPELVVLFLPLAAWIVASRVGHWHTLLAATVVTVAIAVPVLVLTAAVETFITPRLLGALAG